MSTPRKVEQTQSDAYVPPFIQKKVVKSFVLVLHERTRARTALTGDERYEITKFVTNLHKFGVLKSGNVAFMASFGCDFLESLRGIPAKPTTP